MRFTAFQDGSTRRMAVVLGDRLAPLGPVEDCWSDVAGWLRAARAVAEATIPAAEVHQVPAVPLTAKVLCVGLNYRAHAAEGGRDVPTHPNIFARWASTLVADGDEVPLPVGEDGLDFEAELVAVIGAELHGADRSQAAAGILAYACGDDISARGYQERTSQWALGKNADRSAPLGSIVTADDVGELADLAITSRLNGTEMQRSTLGMMVFPPDEVVSYASGALTLHPGDLVYTGTPEGVGYRRNPPVLMGDGDTIEVEIERVGLLTNRIVARR